MGTHGLIASVVLTSRCSALLWQKKNNTLLPFLSVTVGCENVLCCYLSVYIYIYFFFIGIKGYEYDLKFKEDEISLLHTSQIYTFCEQIWTKGVLLFLKEHLGVTLLVRSIKWAVKWLTWQRENWWCCYREWGTRRRCSSRVCVRCCARCWAWGMGRGMRRNLGSGCLEASSRTLREEWDGGRHN